MRVSGTCGTARQLHAHTLALSFVLSHAHLFELHVDLAVNQTPRPPALGAPAHSNADETVGRKIANCDDARAPVVVRAAPVPLAIGKASFVRIATARVHETSLALWLPIRPGLTFIHVTSGRPGDRARNPIDDRNRRVRQWLGSWWREWHCRLVGWHWAGFVPKAPDVSGV